MATKSSKPKVKVSSKAEKKEEFSLISNATLRALYADLRKCERVAKRGGPGAAYDAYPEVVIHAPSTMQPGQSATVSVTLTASGDETLRNVRLSLQPTDAPPDPASLEKIIEHMQSDEILLFSTDYPHGQFEGMEVLPQGLPKSLVRKIMVDNPRATYARLLETVT